MVTHVFGLDSSEVAEREQLETNILPQDFALFRSGSPILPFIGRRCYALATQTDLG